MKTKRIIGRICLLVIALIPAFGMAQSPSARPGKGMTIVPGDYVEMSNTFYQGEKRSEGPSTIMVALGTSNKLEKVMVISVKGDKVLSTGTVSYDLTQEKVERGKLLDSGKETLNINGSSFECTWEKRRDQETTATFWRCPDLPFEGYARVQMQSDDGRKLVSEVIIHGPNNAEDEKEKKFVERLKALQAQQRADK